MTPILGLLQILGIGLVVALVTLILYTAWMLTHPPRRTYAWALARRQPGAPGELDESLAFEESTIDTSKGPFPIWDIPGRNPDGPVVFMSHGWGSSRVGALKRLVPIVEHASRVIAWDLPGHGEAPMNARLGADEHEIAAEMLDELGLKESPMVLYGWSMGAGVSLALCEQIQSGYDVRGVICESVYRVPPTPARAVLALRGMPHRFSLSPALVLLGLKFGMGMKWWGFDRAEIASRVSVPILLLHGDQDPVSPFKDANSIDDVASESELARVEGAGHNNIWTDPVFRQQASDVVGAFMSRVS